MTDKPEGLLNEDDFEGITQVVYPKGVENPKRGDCYVFDGKEFHKYYKCPDEELELIKKGLYGGKDE